MGKEVVWTVRATASLSDVLEYLESEWSSRIAKAFIDELLKRVEIISAYPELGIQSPSQLSWRRVLITKQNALIYRIDRETIVLLDIVDTRTSGYYGLTW